MFVSVTGAVHSQPSLTDPKEISEAVGKKISKLVIKKGVKQKLQ